MLYVLYNKNRKWEKYEKGFRLLPPTIAFIIYTLANFPDNEIKKYKRKNWLAFMLGSFYDKSRVDVGEARVCMTFAYLLIIPRWLKTYVLAFRYL